MATLLSKVKANLILTHDADDELLLRLIDATVAYVESEKEPSKNVLVGQATKNCLPG